MTKRDADAEQHALLVEMQSIVRAAAGTPQPGDSVKAQIVRSARRLAISHSRATTLWYGQRCALLADEADALRHWYHNWTAREADRLEGDAQRLRSANLQMSVHLDLVASPRRHIYRARVEWTGNQASGTRTIASYSRDHIIHAPGKPPISGSSDPSFRGDATRWNPEELLLASLSACHQLWYLSLCAEAGIVVTAYTDDAEGRMTEEPGGAGQFVSVTLRPRVTLATGSDHATAEHLHHAAHEKCFIARSVNFPVQVEARLGEGKPLPPDPQA